MFDLISMVKDRINSYINFYYVIIFIVNRLIACLSKITINLKDIFAAPPDPIGDAKKNLEKLNEENQAAMKKAQEDMQKMFKPLPLPPPPPMYPAMMPQPLPQPMGH